MKNQNPAKIFNFVLCYHLKYLRVVLKYYVPSIFYRYLHIFEIYRTGVILNCFTWFCLHILNIHQISSRVKLIKLPMFLSKLTYFIKHLQYIPIYMQPIQYVSIEIVVILCMNLLRYSITTTTISLSHIKQILFYVRLNLTYKLNYAYTFKSSAIAFPYVQYMVAL